MSPVFKRQNNDGFRFTRAIRFRLDAVHDAGYELSGTATMIPDEPVETSQSVSVHDLEQSATMTCSASGRFDHPFPDSATLTGTSSVRSNKEKLTSTTAAGRGGNASLRGSVDTVVTARGTADGELPFPA